MPENERQLIDSFDMDLFFFVIGGPTAAAGMAIAHGWIKLVGACLPVGTFGYVAGTWLGILVGSLPGT